MNMTTADFAEGTIVSYMAMQLAKFDIQRKQYPETSTQFRRAAVLMPVTVRNGEIFLLLTQRSKHLRSYPSAVSFPGGVRDDTDISDIDTALREAEEEIGLPRSCVKVLAVLNLGFTLPNTVVYPVVGLIPNDFQPKVNPQEVETAFYIPLKEFNSPEVMYSNVSIHGKVFQSATLKYIHDDEMFVIYGFTALHCIVLARVIFDKNAEELLSSLENYFNYISQRVMSQSESKL